MAVGESDVDDCVNGARYLTRRGLVDEGTFGDHRRQRVATHTLRAHVSRRFKAGASHYGVSDLEALEVDTHKFESRYIAKLVAPIPNAPILP